MKTVIAKSLGSALIGVLTFGAAAQAACSLEGKWKVTQQLTFPAGGGVVECTFTFKANGNYAGPCKTYTTVGNAVDGDANGRLRLAKDCSLKGTMRAPGLADTTVRGGHVSDNVGHLIGTRGPGPKYQQIRTVIMTKMDD